MNFKIAVDASVAIKWYVRTEIDADKALAMLYDYENNKLEFIVPYLFYYEVASALNTAVLRKRIAEYEGQDIIEDLLSMDIIVVADNKLIERAYLYAKRYNVSVYDATYLTIAKQYCVPLYTADKKFYDAIKNKERLVRWIGDYKAHQR